MKGSAEFSACNVYRYRLTRDWGSDGPRCCWVMLNPSTADAEKNDPTVRRCIGYSQEWGFAGLVVVNIFALRATDPNELRRHKSPVGISNDQHIREAATECARVVCAWGAHGSYMNRHSRVLEMLNRVCEPMHLGLTKAGLPKHPLYLRSDTEPKYFERRP